MFWYGSKDIVRIFRKGNVIVAGHKGRGKDLLFQYVISRREKDGERHAANIRYTKKTQLRSISYYELTNNSLKNFISGKFETESKQFTQHEDFYISDAGVHLPSHESHRLDKDYPTLPTVYALSRHLGEFNIHANTQDYLRLWNKLREQADYCITCEKCRVLFGKIVFQRIIIYDRPQSAFEGILPYKINKSIFHPGSSSETRARADEFNARYGYVRRRFFWWIMPKIHYDTRAFYRKLYKNAPPKINKKKHRGFYNTKKQQKQQQPAIVEENEKKDG